jgi:hypothetical protein
MRSGFFPGNFPTLVLHVRLVFSHEIQSDSEPIPPISFCSNPGGWHSGNASDSVFGRFSVHISTGTPTVVTEAFLLSLSPSRSMRNSTSIRPWLLQSPFHLVYILSRDGVTKDGFGLAIRFIAHLYTQLVTTSNNSAIVNSLQHTFKSSSLLCLCQTLSGKCFQRRTFLFNWVHEFSPASATATLD